VSYGGAYTRSQMLAYVLPYRKQRDRWVEVEDHAGGLDEIRDQVRALNVTWDLVTLELPDAIEGCREGLLEPIDPAGLAPAPDGTPAQADFYDPALQRCAVGSDIFGTVVAYDRRRYGQRAPATLADFFDTDRFPGRRGLRLRPEVNLEWALIADGVPAGEIYDVLSTEQGLERAFTVLDRIRDSIVWWREGDEPPQLLATGQVAMSSAWNGRIYDEVQNRGAPLAIVWDHQVWNMDVWAIPRGTPNRSEALDFITFATTADRMAEQARVVPYGPARRSALELIPANIKVNLPTAEGRRESAVIIDYAWWSERRADVQIRFDAWRRGEDRFTYDFNPPDAP